LKIVGLIIVVVTGALLIYAAADFPAWSDPASPASTYLSPYFIEKTMEETSVPNIVTAVLADYRGFDTMFETTVIFSAGVVCFFLLRIWTPPDLIIKTGCRILIPFIQLFALYVIAHGHHSPGGGFQGGVILGASVILFAISHDLRTAVRRMSEKLIAILCAVGVLIYAGTGALCLLLKQNFLDYSALAGLLHVDPITARSHGILMVEIGVGIAVLATMIWIYNNVSSAGRYRQGL
jgi:multicomponent Na+:H+ antiporter subunit B